MGYILPYTPTESIQYRNRINFDRWRSVYPVERKVRPRPLDRKDTAAAAAAILGRGKHVDQRV